MESFLLLLIIDLLFCFLCYLSQQLSYIYMDAIKKVNDIKFIKAKKFQHKIKPKSYILLSYL